MVQIEDFNICSSSADNDIFFNDKFRMALTMAIQHLLDECKEEVEPSKLTLYLYPDSQAYWFEIKDRRINPTICLKDSLQDWLRFIEKAS